LNLGTAQRLGNTEDAAAAVSNDYEYVMKDYYEYLDNPEGKDPSASKDTKGPKDEKGSKDDKGAAEFF